MKAILATSLLGALLLAQSGRRPAPQRPPDPEIAYACGNKKATGARPCQCSKQAMEHSDEVLATCDKEYGGDRIKCLNRLHKDPCEIVAEPDKAHPAHSCQRWCRRDRAACMCHNDSPVCWGKEIVPRDGEGEDQNEHQ